MRPPTPRVDLLPASLTRRGVLALGAAAAVALLAPRSLRAEGAATRRIVLHNTHTLETLATDYCREGRYCSDALGDVSRVLRDHRNGAEHPIDPALLDLLCSAAERCGRDAEFEVISGYRSPQSNAEMHARSPGVAARVRAAGRKITVEPKAITIPNTATGPHAVKGPVPIRIFFCEGPSGEIIEFFENEKT